jgi:type I restriction enzyme S subunit
MPRDLSYPPSVKPGIPKLGKKPNDWSKVKFRDILETVERPAIMDDDTSYQLVNAKRGRGGIVPREILLGQNIKTKSQFLVKEGDFLISKRQIVHGACGIVPKELNNALISNEYSTLIAKNGLCINFFIYYSHSIHFQQTCFHSSVGVAIEKMIFRINDWMKHDIYLPPYPEQKKIAEILSTWDTAIENTERLVATKKRLMKAIMQQLLRGKIRIKKFKGERWKKNEFGDFAHLLKDKFDPHQKCGVLKCIELEHIDQDTGRLLGYVESNQQSCVKNIFKKGHVLFGKLRPYLKKYYYAQFDGVCSSEIWVLGANEKLCNREFLFYVIRTNEFNQAANVTSGTKMPRSDWDYVSEIPFLLPPLNEQQYIASVLKTGDKEIDLLERQLESLKQQKKGLMQKLLTGKFRVRI